AMATSRMVMRLARRLAPVAAAFSVTLFAGCSTSEADESPILIEQQGSFAVGGTVLGDPASSLHCDHGVVDYQIPPDPRAVNLLMWHSASARGWQNRWDGGEGFQT